MNNKITEFVHAKGEVSLADLAIHLMVDPDEVRAMVEPLIKAGLVERIWRPMSNELRQLCDCDREEVFRWVGK